MSSNNAKPESGHLYVEIAHMKEYIWEMEDNHRRTLSEWTRKCGQLGNEIGRLRKQLGDYDTEHRAELDRVDNNHRSALNTWMKKCDQMGSEIGPLRQFVSKTIQQQTELDQLTHEIDLLRQRLLEKETECSSKFEMGLANETELNNELKGLRSKLAEISIENANLRERCCVTQTKDDAMDLNGTINTCDISQCELDEEKIHLNDSVETTDLSKGSQQDLVPCVTEQGLEDDEDLKRKSKSSLWETLKRRMSAKGKREKDHVCTSSTLTLEVSEIEEK